MTRWLLLTVVVLAACQAVAPVDSGQSYEVLSWTEEDLGHARLSREGDRQVETITLSGSDDLDELRWTGHFSRHSSPERGEAHVDRVQGRSRWRAEADWDQEGWRWRAVDGLAVERREGAGAPDRLLFSSALPADQWSVSLFSWQSLEPAVGHSGGSGLNLLEGRLEPWRADIREEVTLEAREGPPVQAWRGYAHTPASGAEVWLAEDGSLLALRQGLSGVRLVRDGLTLPEAPPPPVPEGVVEEPWQVDSDGAVLRGLVALPDRPPPPAGFPAVVLIAGSGPVDRDGNRHGTLRELARLLAKQGFVVWRHDKRGVGESTMEEGATATLPDLVADVRAGLDALSGRSEVDGRQLFLVGHSEGGLVAPIAARGDSRVRGLILLASPARSLDKLLPTQLQLILDAHGLEEEEIRRAERQQEVALSLVRSGKDKDLGLPGGTMASDWLRSHMEHDPESTWQDVQAQVLAIYGSDDLQVPPGEAEHLRDLVAHLPARVVVLPDMDHLLCLVDEHTLPGMGIYGDLDRPLAPALLRELTTWLEPWAPAP